MRWTATARKLDLAAHVYRELSDNPLFHLLAEPELSTVAFRLRRGDTAELLRRVNAEGGVLLAGTTVDGHCTARMRVLNHRTDEARVNEAIDALHRHATTIGEARGERRGDGPATASVRRPAGRRGGRPGGRGSARSGP